MAQTEPPVNSDVLHSWKEVAVYMGRGIRTVQRWERELQLPVRRPRGKSRSAVIAIKSELDQWLLGSPTGHSEIERISETERIKVIQKGIPQRAHVDTAAVLKTSHQLLERCSYTRQQTINLCTKLNRTLALATKLLEHS